MQYELPLNLPKIRCEHCGSIVGQPLYVVKHFGLTTKQLPFCNEGCASQHYLERLRREGI